MDRIDPIEPRRDAPPVQRVIRLAPVEREARRREREERRRKRREAAPARPDDAGRGGLDIRA